MSRPVEPSTDQSVAALLESLLPHLETMNALHESADDRSVPGLRRLAQRLLFRTLRPYAFQRAQLQSHVIMGFRYVALALRRQEQLQQGLEVRVRELTRELTEAKRELKRLQGQPDTHRV